MKAVGRQVTLERKAVHFTGVTSVFGGVGKERRRSLSCGLPTLQALPKGAPSRLPQALFLSLLTQGVCLCYLFPLPVRAPFSWDQSCPPAALIHSGLPKGKVPCPLDHNLSPSYAITAPLSLWCFSRWDVTFTHVFLWFMSVSPTWAWTHWGQEQCLLLLVPDTDECLHICGMN